jgi:hypothetical protein
MQVFELQSLRIHKNTNYHLLQIDPKQTYNKVNFKHLSMKKFQKPQHIQTCLQTLVVGVLLHKKR